MKTILTALLLPTAVLMATGLPGQSTGARTSGGNRTLVRPDPRTPEEEERRRTAITEAVERAAASVINVYVQVGDEPRTFIPFSAGGDFVPEGQGSGVILEDWGLAITNWHVVATATEKSGEQKKDHRVKISLNDGKEYDAAVLSTDARHDLALLQIQLGDEERLRAIELGNSDDMMLGETVIAIGNPLGHASSVSTGVLSAVDREIQVKPQDGLVRKYEGLLQMDAETTFGNSGGALIDINGKLVGINNAGSATAKGIGFSIPVSTVRSVLRELLSNDRLRGFVVGLRVEDTDGDVVVTEVDDDGPAGRDGIRVGDRLIEADGLPVGTSFDLSRALLRASADRDLELVVERDGQTRRFAPRPLSNTAYGVIRMTGIELAEIPFRDDTEQITAASIALHPTGQPSEYMASALRVVHVRQGTGGQESGVQRGDLFLGLEIVVTTSGFESSELSEYKTLSEIYDSFVELTKNGAATGRCWLWRGGRIIKRDLKILKL